MSSPEREGPRRGGGVNESEKLPVILRSETTKDPVFRRKALLFTGSFASLRMTVCFLNDRILFIHSGHPLGHGAEQLVRDGLGRVGQLIDAVHRAEKLHLAAHVHLGQLG